MAIGKFPVLSDPANNNRIKIKAILLLATIPFVIITFIGGGYLDIIDGVFLLVVSLHLAFQVRVSFNKTLDSFAWNERCQAGKLQAQIVFCLLMTVGYVGSTLEKHIA